MGGDPDEDAQRHATAARRRAICGCPMSAWSP